MAERIDPSGELDPTLAVGDASTLADDAAPAPADGPGGLRSGARLGRYRLGARLGAGAMGVVWAARDPNLDRPVAIKVVHPAFARAPDAAARLLREARAMAKVSHPAVVVVHDAGEADGQLFLAMELVEGTTLGKLLRERGDDVGDWRRWVALLVEAGRGLAAAHAVGIVHRDFKPDNVLVATSGRVCVGDFGVAELSAVARAGSDLAPAASSQAMRVDDLTSTGALVGTPAYMSPEQLRGSSADARSDQFSFCVTLHEALYGVRPFALPTRADHAVAALIETIEAGEVVAPPRDSRVPGWIREVILRGLSPRPEARWPDMAALLAALTPPRAWRRWLPVGAAALVAGVVVAGVIGLRRGEPAASGAGASTPAEAALPTAAAPSVEVHFSVPMRATLAVSPDGARIAVGSAERLVVHDVDSDRLIPFARQGERTIGYLEFVDADHLAMVRVGAAPEVETWDLVADRVVTARSLPPRTRWFGSVRDGDLLMRAAADGSELVVGDLDHQRRLALMRRPIEILAIAPTRDRIAFVESSAYGGRLVVIDVASGATVRGDDIVELTGVTWHDADHLWITTGTTVDPAILEVDVAADHLGAPRRIYHQERGWFGSIVTAAGRTFFVNSANTFRAKLVTRGGAVQDVDPELFGAGLAWLDDTRWLAWNRTTGELAPSDDGAADRVAAAIDGEPGNATRAGDLVIVAMRKPGGRELVAVSLGDARRRWTLPVGTAALVRCAGDARPPCVAVVQPEDDDARVVRIDLATGALGDEITRARVIQDVAVSPDGAEVLVCDGSPAIRAVALATGATRGSYRVPMSVTRGITYDPAGGFLVAGTKPPVSYQILRIDGDRQDVLAQSDTEILFMPRPSPAGDRVLVMGRLFMPKLYELR